MRKKITVIGSGNVGASCAIQLAQKELGDVVVVDIREGWAAGTTLDMYQYTPVAGVDAKVTGGSNYEATAGSDIVVLTAGFPRKPGMSRDDLVWANYDIVKGTLEQAARQSPNSILIVVTNPLDPMCHVAYEVSGFPKHRVLGMAGILDTARFRAFIADKLGVSVEDVQTLVLGGHGDAMVPLVRYTSVGGIPLTDLMDADTIQALVKRTAGGGGEIVKMMGTSAYYAPAAAAVQMVEAILKDKKRVLPCSALLEGEYGIQGLYMGVPVKLGAKGIEQIFELKLTDEESAALNKSAAGVKEVVDLMEPKLAEVRAARG
ncbi:MAG: malate dehydrogenase [Acidobacteria bacterium]|nr:malate dehydrogenase [Acidobacteriota bacterium]